MYNKLPYNWIDCFLEDVILKIANGSSTKQYDKKVGYPITRIETIWDEKIDLHRVKYIKEYDNEFIKKYSLNKNDILLSHINSDSHLGKTAIFKNETEILIHGINLLLIRSSSLLNADFLNYQFKYLKFKGVFIDVAQRAVNQSSINQRKLKAFNIRLPPLPEQRAIVSKIEQLFSDLDNGIDNFKKAQEQLKRYRQSVLKAACEGRLVPTEAELARVEGRDYEPADVLLARILEERREKWNGRGKYKEPAVPDTNGLSELPEGWAWATFDQVSDRVTVGHVGSMKDEYVESGIPFLRSQNVRENKFESNGLKFISREFYEKLKKSSLQPGDLVVVRSGSVGTTCVIPETLTEANCSDLVIVKQPRAIHPQYGAFYMNSIAQSRINAKKVGVALTHFNTKSMAEMPIPIPPLMEQRHIVDDVERRLSICDKLETTITESLQKAESLRQSILKKAFEGKLLSEKELEEARNAPDWEPAEKLLERIKAEKTNTKRKNKGKK